MLQQARNCYWRQRIHTKNLGQSKYLCLDLLLDTNCTIYAGICHFHVKCIHSLYGLKLWFIKFRGLLKREWKSYKSYFLLNVRNTEQHNQRETVDNYRKWNKSIVLNAMCYFLMILSRIINPFFLPSLGCKDFKHVIKFTCVHNQNR